MKLKAHKPIEWNFSHNAIVVNLMGRFQSWAIQLTILVSDSIIADIMLSLSQNTEQVLLRP